MTEEKKPIGRPTDFTPEMGEEILSVNPNDEMFCGLKGKWRGVKETEWCKFAMERQEDWLPVLGLEPFDRHDLEVQVKLGGMGTRKSGLPRIDAVGWRGDKATLIETKVEVSPGNMLGGVGQLLYYSEIVTQCMGWKVEGMILLSPAWPAFLIQAVERYNLPVSLVQVTPDMIYGVRGDGYAKTALAS